MSANGHDIPGPGNITRKVLDTGITALVYENFTAQSVVVYGQVETGSIVENPAQNGVASLTANALMRGTTSRDFEMIHASLEDIGADLSIGARVHRTGFNGKSLAEDLPTLIEVLADVLRSPVFPEPEVERLRGEMLTWLQYSMHDTRYRAGRAFREALYPENHPYHRSVYGTLETLPGISVEALKAFHRQHYGPKGMIITVVGAVKASDALDVIERYLGDWQNPDQAPMPALPELMTLQEKRHTSVTVAGKTQSDIVLGVAGPSRVAPDYQAATLANSVLGQFGMMGRVGNIIREKLGLAYYAYSSIEGGHGPGAWKIVAGVNPANVELTIERAQDEIQRIMNEPVSDDDLADNQSQFTGRLPLQLESNEGLAARILAMESYQLGLDYLVNYHSMIYSLNKDDLLRAVQSYWHPDAFVVAVAGPDGAEPAK